MPIVNSEIKTYVRDNIIPLYSLFDKGHGLEHIEKVIENSLLIASEYDVNIDMVYVIAAYHDAGLKNGREGHEKASAAFLKEDMKLKNWFSDDEILIMSEAVEDHRASNDYEPRGIYGKIISEADRDIDYITILTRTIQYSIRNFPHYSAEQHFERVYEHIYIKYGENGYLKLWLNTEKNQQQLKELRLIITSRDKVKNDFFEIYNTSKTYDVFLFDADGTLYDFDKAEENALKTMFERCGFAYSEKILSRYRKINEKVWDIFEKGEITKDELQTLRFKRLFNEIGVNYDVKQFNSDYLNELGKGSFLIEGALEICKKITSCGKKIYIVTNGILATQKARIEHSLISGYISDYFVSEVVGYNKPNVLYFEYVLEHISRQAPVDINKILIIGDSLTADIAGGNNAGIDSCWFNKLGRVNNTNIKPTYEINALIEINRYF